MHEVLQTISLALNNLAHKLEQTGDESAVSLSQSNPAYPGIDRSELVEMPRHLEALITSRGGDDLDEDEKRRVEDYPRRIEFLADQAVNQLWSNPNALISYIITLDSLRRAVTPLLATDEREIANLSTKVTALQRQVRAKEARLDELNPRIEAVSGKIDRIEEAHDAADQLPLDLKNLGEARTDANKIKEELDALLDKGRSHLFSIGKFEYTIDQISDRLKLIEISANATLERCESAYSAATSQGLAAAFSNRSQTLAISMAGWIVGLIAALVSGVWYGSSRLTALSEAIGKSDVSTSLVLINVALAVLSVGAPVWFAWLSTKQIGQQFRLSEDYAFKASISRAYEGYRKEAARFDQDMEERLLTSALTRLDEQPLRLVEPSSFGSPWHELVSSEPVKEALRTIPNFSSKVVELARNTMSEVRPKNPPPKQNTTETESKDDSQ